MSPRSGVVREFLSGIGLLLRGFGTWRTAPGLMLLSVIPAVIVAALFLAGFIALGLNLTTLATAVTPFAENWEEPLRSGMRLLAGLAFVVAAVFLVVNTFTAITLVVGQPFYERIWSHVEGQLGPMPEASPVGFWRTARAGVADAIRMLVPTVLVGAVIFALGFVPIVGTVLSAVLGALVGGWFLAIELTAAAFDARGRTLRERRKALGSRRALSVGFGLATYLLFLIPLGAIFVMPAAVAGSAHLARRVLDEPTQRGEPNRVVTPGL